MQGGVWGGPKVVVECENFTMFEGPIPKFMSKFAGLFPIVEQMFKDVCKLKLSTEIKVHRTFHVSGIKIIQGGYVVAQLQASN